MGGYQGFYQGAGCYFSYYQGSFLLRHCITDIVSAHNQLTLQYYFNIPFYLSSPMTTALPFSIPLSTPTVPPLHNNPGPLKSVPVLPQIMAPPEEGIPLGRISVSETERGMGLTVRTGAFGPFPPFALPEHEYRPLEAPLRGIF